MRGKGIKARLFFILDRLRSALKRLVRLFRDTERLKKLYEELNNEKNKRSLKLLLGEIKALLTELRPRKGGGYLVLGLSDPYETGKAMEAAAFLYPLYGDSFEVSPDFEKERAEGEINARGRVRLAVVLRSLIKLYRDKNLMKLIRRITG